MTLNLLEIFTRTRKFGITKDTCCLYFNKRLLIIKNQYPRSINIVIYNVNRILRNGHQKRYARYARGQTSYRRSIRIRNIHCQRL